jgi:murein DD-endopeptidase MepM/ murein hydrolase activator NlpD
VIRLAALAGAATAVFTPLAAATSIPQDATTAARATILGISVPGRQPVALGQVAWPKTSGVDVQSFSYPADGSIATLGLSRANVSAQTGQTANAQASVDAVAVSLFGGEVVASDVTAQASAGASRHSAGADTTGSSVAGLRAVGQDVPTSPGTHVPLGEWGTLDLVDRTVQSRQGRSPAALGTVVALRITLTAAHAGLPAGSQIVLGSAEAEAVAEPPAPTQPLPHGVLEHGGPTVTQAPVPPRPPEPANQGATIPGGPVRSIPPNVKAQLTSAGFVFPVFGSVSFGDSFGAPRPDVQGGWHHGEDVFAPLGSPVLAVASGTLYSIGWNKIGGYRLWLRDRAGDEFYYAHLSAYSPLAIEGNQVTAGDVIGFVGKTGDAEGGSPHLHFEIHPASMIGLGYDGVVAPYPFLLAWRHLADISFADGRIYVPSRRGVPKLPPPGAVLLQAEDIAATSGLVPGALARTLARESRQR